MYRTPSICTWLENPHAFMVPQVPLVSRMAFRKNDKRDEELQNDNKIVILSMKPKNKGIHKHTYVRDNHPLIF